MMEAREAVASELEDNCAAENVLGDFVLEGDPSDLEDDMPLTQEESDALDGFIATKGLVNARHDELERPMIKAVQPSSAVPVSGMSAEEEAEIEHLHLPDGPVAKGQTIREAMKAFIERQNQEKAARKGKSKRTPKQQEIADYRKGDGREAWNEYQKAKRWVKAEQEGRTISPRLTLTNMSPEEKEAHKRAQAAERQRRKRAAQRSAQSTT